MCQFLLEKTGNKGYDSTDLFVHCVLTYFNSEEGSSKIGKALQNLIVFITQSEREREDSKVHNLIMDWMDKESSVVNVVHCTSFVMRISEIV